MDKIIDLKEAISFSKKLRDQSKTVVLVGGCFDILHPGHEYFLTRAKKVGDILMVLLESDENVRRLKGAGRPVNNQEKRAQTLTKLDVVDYVVLLGEIAGDRSYFEMTRRICPAIIAVTAGDPKLLKKEMQAKIVGGKVLAVAQRLKEYSTTKILEKGKYEDFGN